MKKDHLFYLIILFGITIFFFKEFAYLEKETINHSAIPFEEKSIGTIMTVKGRKFFISTSLAKKYQHQKRSSILRSAPTGDYILVEK